MGPQIVRYSERPELWDSIGDLSDEVWPEYNTHGEALGQYWGQLYKVFPDWQFVLYDPTDAVVLAEGQPPGLTNRTHQRTPADTHDLHRTHV